MLSLDVIVVGGGIAGLATAFSLQRAGHKVTVLESQQTIHSSKAGLKSPPNMSRILDAWGLGPMLKERGIPCERIVWHTGETGEIIGLVSLYAEFLAELLAGFYFLSHSDLHQSLLDIAVQRDVKVRYSAKVVQVDASAGNVTLENGEIISGDLIVGADGPSSTIRQTITGDHGDQTEGQDFVIIGLSIPTDSLEKSELPFFKSEDEWAQWYGDGYFLGVHRTDGGKVISVHMCEPASKAKVKLAGDDWIEHPFKSFKLEDGMTFDPQIEKLLAHATTYTRMTHKRRPLLESFTDESGKCVLVGDAAHPLSPFGTQSTALSIEDAKVLGVLLSRIQTKDQLPHFLSAYEELRMPICHENQTWDIQKRELFTLPKGELQEQRDARWRASGGLKETSWDVLDHEAYWKVWGGEMSQYMYHAREAAEDWWTKWGAVLLRDMEESKGDALRSPTQVRIERVEKQGD